MEPRPEELVKKAEEALGLRFAPQYSDFLLRFGTAYVGFYEIYGVINEEFSNSSVPDSIWCTLVERREVGLLNHLVIISDTGNGGFLCLDFKKLTTENEPSVVYYQSGLEEEFQTYEVVAEDFGDFLLDYIKQKM